MYPTAYRWIEHRRQRVEEQPEVDVERPDVEELEEADLHALLRARPAQREEVGEPEDERGANAEHAEPVAPAIGALAEE